jgi:RAD51-like protein 1
MSSSRSLDRLGLDPLTKEKLSSMGIKTAQNVFEVSAVDVMFGADLSAFDFMNVVRTTSAKIAPKPKTALEMMVQPSTQRRLIPMGCDGFDAISKGGFRAGGISEIVGPPGIGKTQVCLCTCLEALFQDDTASVVYIDTELKFDPLRLASMAAKKRPELFSRTTRSAAAERNVDALLQRVQVLRPESCKEILNLVQNIDDTVISNNVTLIVMDSIAALPRKEMQSESDRESFGIAIAVQLMKVADLCNCVVIATNQIVPLSTSNDVLKSTTTTRDPHGLEITGATYDAVVRSCSDSMRERISDTEGEYASRSVMGMFWHHSVSSRITLFRRFSGDSEHTMKASDERRRILGEAHEGIGEMARVAAAEGQSINVYELSQVSTQHSQEPAGDLSASGRAVDETDLSMSHDISGIHRRGDGMKNHVRVMKICKSAIHAPSETVYDITENGIVSFGDPLIHA